MYYRSITGWFLRGQKQDKLNWTKHPEREHWREGLGAAFVENKRDFLNWEHSKGAGGLSLPKGKTTHAGDVCQVAEHKEPSFPPYPSLTPPKHTHTSLSSLLQCFPLSNNRRKCNPSIFKEVVALIQFFCHGRPKDTSRMIGSRNLATILNNTDIQRVLSFKHNWELFML